MLFLFFLGSGALESCSEGQVGEINSDARPKQLLLILLGFFFGT